MGLKKERLLEAVDRKINVRDRVVILEQNGKLCEIHTVEDINEDRILVPYHSIPWEDVTEYMSPEGRVFVLHAPEEYIQETRHLASVEQATVIRHAIQYEKMSPDKFEIGKLMPWIAILVMAILLVVKK